MKRILVVFGTRPEAIKLAPVIRALKQARAAFKVVTCVTAQHREMLDQVLDFFELAPDRDLDLMRPNQTLAELTGRVLRQLDPVLMDVKPDWLVVQGDTTTAMAATLAAYYRGIRVAHVEAGLRTSDKRAPFPEEINRRVASVIADLHFAPTENNRRILLQEGIAPAAICVTGNTVIDALRWARKKVTRPSWRVPASLKKLVGTDRQVLLVTGHRRESFGEGFEQICLALRDLVRRHNELDIVYPVHLNPNVREPVYRLLGAEPRIRLIEPLPYPDFVWLMSKAWLVLTDSGGVQEEAPSLGKPVLVMRETTERTEGVAAGNARLVGVRRSVIVEQIERLLRDEKAWRRMARVANPYGDGRAAERIAARLKSAE